MFGALTTAALVFGWGLGFAITGLVLTGIAGLVVLASGPGAPQPLGPVAVRLDLDVTSSEGDVHRLKVIAIVQIATHGHAAQSAATLYRSATTEDIAGAASALLESLVRARLTGASGATLEQATILDRQPGSWYSDAFVRLGLDLHAVWVGPRA